jgi:hypothetical protein
MSANYSLLPKRPVWLPSRASPTVEQRIVRGPYSSADQEQPSNAAKETFWCAASAAAEALGSSGELILDACPCFLGVGSRHVGGVRSRVGVLLIEACRRRRWRREVVVVMRTTIIGESQPPTPSITSTLSLRVPCIGNPYTLFGDGYTKLNVVFKTEAR